MSSTRDCGHFDVTESVRQQTADTLIVYYLFYPFHYRLPNSFSHFIRSPTFIICYFKFTNNYGGIGSRRLLLTTIQERTISRRCRLRGKRYHNVRSVYKSVAVSRVWAGNSSSYSPKTTGRGPPLIQRTRRTL